MGYVKDQSLLKDSEEFLMMDLLLGKAVTKKFLSIHLSERKRKGTGA